MSSFFSLFRRDMNREKIEQFLKSKVGLSAETTRFYRNSLDLYLEFVGDKYPPTPDIITDFIEYCKNRPSRLAPDKKITKGTVHAYFRAVKTWCLWLLRTGAISDNPLVGISIPKQPKVKIPRAPEPEVTNAVLKYLEAEVELAIRQNSLVEKWEFVRDLAIISFLLGTGCRVGEAQGLLLSDLDLENKRAYIREPKDGEDRYVKFSQQVKADLQLWLKVRDGLSIDTSIQTIFVSEWRDGLRAISYWTIRRRVLKWCNAAHVDKFNVHSLRHAYAIRSLENGAPLTDIRDQLGHESVATTNIYLKAASKRRDERLEDSGPR